MLFSQVDVRMQKSWLYDPSVNFSKMEGQKMLKYSTGENPCGKKDCAQRCASKAQGSLQ
jgi:hypothetical protein